MEPIVLVINESTAESLITDTYTFGCFIGCLFLNYYFLGNSTILKIFICILLILITSLKSKTKKMTPDEALKYFTAKQKKKSE